MENKIISILESARGSTIARLSTTTAIKPAAKFKETVIEKTTVSSVILFGTVSQYRNAYLRRVKKTALFIDSNDKNAIDNFELSDPWHCQADTAYSIRKHKEKNDGKRYLFPMFCHSVESVFSINGSKATREEVAVFLTPSESKKLLDNSGIVENKKNGVKHSAIVRTIALENINWLKIKSQFITK